MPWGGLAWHHLQYLLGLAEMGHDVWFLEDSTDQACCYNPQTYESSEDPTYGLRFLGSVLARLQLGERWAYYDAHSSTWLGPASGQAPELCASADLLLNLSCVNPLRPWTRDVPVRALVDTDPVFVQVRHLTNLEAREAAEQHNRFFSFGENIRRGATMPDDGLEWLPTRQPIVLDAWPSIAAPADGRFTTVMQWDSYREAVWDARSFGMKSASFDPYIDVPQRVGAELEIALAGAPQVDRLRLQAAGWKLRDPQALNDDPWEYQRYLQSSKAEFTVCKEAYVKARTGWFSERSAAYLASGRPVVTQDSGFSTWLPCGEGVLPFSSPEEAVLSVEKVIADYKAHSQAARGIAAAYFDHRQVLGAMIEAAMSFSPAEPHA